MNLKNDNLSFDDSVTQLNKNISRLVKLENDSNKPSRAFTQSLIDSALDELKRLKIKEKGITSQVSCWKRAIGWAAMLAAACGTGLTFVVSALLAVNTFLTVIATITTFANWLTFFGGLVL